MLAPLSDTTGHPVPPGARPCAPAVRLPLASRALAPLATPADMHGPSAVRLTFAEPGLAHPQAAVAGLTVLGVAPQRLRRLCVLSGGGEPVLDIDTVSNGRGGELTAGEMLSAMSAMDGHANLTITLQPGSLRLRGLAVHLHLSDPQPWSDACIEVQACMA